MSFIYFIGIVKALGFAEADPTADVEGLDVQAKIALLANLSFGAIVPVGAIPTSGINKFGWLYVNMYIFQNIYDTRYFQNYLCGL